MTPLNIKTFILTENQQRSWNTCTFRLDRPEEGPRRENPTPSGEDQGLPQVPWIDQSRRRNRRHGKLVPKFNLH